MLYVCHQGYDLLQDRRKQALGGGRAKDDEEEGGGGRLHEAGNTTVKRCGRMNGIEERWVDVEVLERENSNSLASD